MPPGAFRARLARLALATLLPLSTGALAGEAPLFPPGSQHDATVPTTERVLGHSLGDRPTDYTGVQTYMRALSRDHTRVFQRTYGVTPEERPLRYLVISHPDNMERLEAIRSGSVRLSDPRTLPPAEAEAIIRSNPAIVWLACGIHGDEDASTEAALALAYHLAAARDERTMTTLRNAVVIIDPIQNPDGRERFLAYLRQVRGPRPRTDPQAIEHDEPWPGGRYNHNLFDLSLDWFFGTQPETRGRVAAFLEWMPQVYVDLHETGSVRTLRSKSPQQRFSRILPAARRNWWNVLGQADATAAEEAGPEDDSTGSHDGHEPACGDTWPTLHGAIGMTFAQASLRGLPSRNEDGTVLEMRDVARHHVTAALATMEAAAAHREELLRDFLAFRRGAVEAGAEGPVRAYLIPPSVPSTSARLASLLAGQGVELRRAEEALTARATTRDAEAARKQAFPRGTLIVDLAQPAGRLAATLMQVAAEDEPSLPLATGTEVWWTGETPRARSSPATPDSLRPRGGVVNLGAPGPTYAYLLGYDGNAAAMALVSLLNLAGTKGDGLRVEAAPGPIRVAGVSFPAGSAILRTRGNPASLAGIVRKEAETFGVSFHAITSGPTESGPDLDSEAFRTLTLPSVAVASGEPVSPPSIGAIQYLLDDVYGLPYTPIRTSSLPDADLSRYNVLILPDESGTPGYAEHLGAGGARKLAAWVEAGGTLVTLGNASRFVARQEMELSTTRSQESEERAPSPDRVPGAILRVGVVAALPAAFGYDGQAAVRMSSKMAFAAVPTGRSVATFVEKGRLRISGLARPEWLERLAGAAYLVDEPRGRGRVILFADDPNFRGQWESLNRMFLNCVIFAPVFGERGRPEL